MRVYVGMSEKQGPQGLQDLSSLKSHKIQNSLPTQSIFTPATNRNDFLIRLYVVKPQRRPNL